MVTLIISLILISCYVYYHLNIFSYWRRRKVVGPVPWPIVGNYGPVLFKFKSESQFIQEIYTKYPNEKCIGIFVGSTPALILKDLEMVRQVFTTEFNKFPNRYISAGMRQFTKSIFLSPTNETWKANRKVFAALSNKNILKKTMEVLETVSKDVIVAIEQLVTKTATHNICSLLETYFFNMVTDAALGKRFGAIGEVSELQNKIRKLERFESLGTLRIVNMAFPNVLNIFKNLLGRMVSLLTADAMNIMYSLIDSRKKLQHRSNNTFADLLLESQELKRDDPQSNLDDETLGIHLTSIVLTGTVTTSTSASFLAFELAQNQQVQNKCYEEICQVLDKFNGRFSLEALEEMKYLDMAIQESFRKYEIVMVINRVCGLKHNFPGTTIEVDPGALMFVPNEAICNDSVYFPEPNKFDPDRFSSENKHKIPKYADLTFGYGPRQCIGQPLSKLLIKMSIASILKKFILRPSEFTPKVLEFDPAFILRKPIGHEIWLQLVDRE